MLENISDWKDRRVKVTDHLSHLNGQTGTITEPMPEEPEGWFMVKMDSNGIEFPFSRYSLTDIDRGCNGLPLPSQAQARHILSVKASEVRVGDDIQLSDGRSGRVRMITAGPKRRMLTFTYTEKGQTGVFITTKQTVITVRRQLSQDQA